VGTASARIYANALQPDTQVQHAQAQHDQKLYLSKKKKSTITAEDRDVSAEQEVEKHVGLLRCRRAV
jgi:hypothetical protein